MEAGEGGQWCHFSSKKKRWPQQGGRQGGPTASSCFKYSGCSREGGQGKRPTASSLFQKEKAAVAGKEARERDQ